LGFRCGKWKYLWKIGGMSFFYGVRCGKPVLFVETTICARGLKYTSLFLRAQAELKLEELQISYTEADIPAYFKRPSAEEEAAFNTPPPQEQAQAQGPLPSSPIGQGIQRTVQGKVDQAPSFSEEQMLQLD
jgi:hypothetical protein